MSRYDWTVARAVDALAGAGLLEARTGAPEASLRDVATDTRTLDRGDLFVALRGENFDGHDFLGQALEAGAGGLVVEAGAELPADVGVPVFRVTDTLRAFGALARHRRRALDAPVVAITGSSGKTTTKELLRSALGDWGRIHATPANFNNRVGLPRTLLDAPDTADAVLLEAGTSEPGEIAALAGIAEPDVSVVITVGPAHLEKLGSIEGVMSEKLDLIRGMKADGTAFVGEDPADLPRRADEIDRTVIPVGFGDETARGVRGRDLRRRADGGYDFEWRGHTVRIAIPGRHVAADALLALAVADHLGASPAAAAAGVGEYRGGSMRDEIRRVGALTLIVDCYNANPQSVRAALRTLAEREVEGDRIAVLGSMLEMGEEERSGHREVLAFAADLPLDLLVLTGSFADAAPSVDAPYHRIVAHDPDDAWERLRDRLEPGRPATVLLKGSRGVALERLVPRFEALAATEEV